MAQTSYANANIASPTKPRTRPIDGLLTSANDGPKVREAGTASRCRQRRSFGLRLRLSPQHQRGDQRHKEPNRKGINERQRCVEEWVFVQLFVFSHLLKFRLDGCRARARGRELVNQVGAIFVPETRQEVVVENFPRHDIADARNQSNGDPDGKSLQEGNLAIANVVAVGSDA